MSALQRLFRNSHASKKGFLDKHKITGHVFSHNIETGHASKQASSLQGLRNLVKLIGQEGKQNIELINSITPETRSDTEVLTYLTNNDRVTMCDTCH
jgi:hypothetical protein